jgi:hypothetical protein
MIFEKKHLRPEQVLMRRRGIRKGESGAAEPSLSRATVHKPSRITALYQILLALLGQNC